MTYFPDCSDKWTSKICAKRERKGRCKVPRVALNCKKTCGACGGKLTLDRSFIVGRGILLKKLSVIHIDLQRNYDSFICVSV